jgi:hypothetical protein
MRVAGAEPPYITGRVWPDNRAGASRLPLPLLSPPFPCCAARRSERHRSGQGRRAPEGEVLPLLQKFSLRVPLTARIRSVYSLPRERGRQVPRCRRPILPSAFLPAPFCQTVAEFSSYIHCRPRLSSLSLPPGFHTHSICGLTRSPVQVGIRLSPGAVHLGIDLTRCRVVSRDRAVARISAKTNVGGLQ